MEFKLMSALQAIVLPDALATPVNHTFDPVSHSFTEFVWRDNTAGLTVLSAPTISLIVLPSKDKNIERYREKTVLPVLETITGSNSSGYTAAPRLGYTLQKIADSVIPSRATLQQRKDLAKFAGQLYAQGQFSDALYYGLRPF